MSALTQGETLGFFERYNELVARRLGASPSRGLAIELPRGTLPLAQHFRHSVETNP
jgi:hypothetical protein